MTSKELNKIERDLQARGFVKSFATLDTENYGWYKVTEDGDVTAYLAELLVWDYWEKDPAHRPDTTDAFRVEGMVMGRGKGLFSMSIEHVESADQLERVAEGFYKLCKKEGLV